MGDIILNTAYPPVPTPNLEEIRTRVADGIFLGGNYNDAHEQYLIAHRDRCYLLKLLDRERQRE